MFAREVLNERCTNRVADDFGRCLKSRKLRDKNLRHISERLPNESFIGKNIRAARQKYESLCDIDEAIDEDPRHQTPVN
ncbi:hypothetical protein TWF173_006991 [Orbilia oligospora]|uniref:Uncharacterized protein n=1 Tax=Orbilia oligospora TaxID=2813651 RepID=A0A7C8VMQ6_ORBOL|nr:hypothetical protein TWF970_005777 [Orbilia oligospora]KAF3312569.1 hypothetical protein TWF173_006991 [Orbilia oligospora]